jgi:hypothetical protein
LGFAWLAKVHQRLAVSGNTARTGRNVDSKPYRSHCKHMKYAGALLDERVALKITTWYIEKVFQ